MTQDKKEMIREAAITVMSQLGFHAATTDKIAKEAGVAVGTVYNYFRQKEEILEYIFLEELKKRKTYYDSLADQTIPVLTKLKKLLRMHFMEVAKNPAVGQILVRERRAPNTEHSQGITQFVQGIPRFLQKMLDEAVANDEIRPCNSEIVGLALFGAVEAIISRAVFEEDAVIQSDLLMEAPDELIELYLLGLEKK